MFFNYLINCFVLVLFSINVWVLLASWFYKWQSRFSSFIIVKAYKCLQMKATLFAAFSIGTNTKSSLRENIVFNFMFTENRSYWSTCYFTFQGTNLFISWWHIYSFSILKNRFCCCLCYLIFSQWIDQYQLVLN